MVEIKQIYTVTFTDGTELEFNSNEELQNWVDSIDENKPTGVVEMGLKITKVEKEE